MFLVDLIHANSRQIETVKHMLAGLVRTGTVSDLDQQKGYRLDWGDDGEGGRWKSPWYPHPESGGDAKTWVPLSKGQTVTSINPTGDPRQGFLIRGGFSDGNPQPSQNLQENVFAFGNVRIEVVAGGVKVTAGGTVFEISTSGIKSTAADYQFD